MDPVQEYYIQTVGKKVEGLRAALQQADCELLGSLLHKIAGSAGGFGYHELSRKARLAEVRAKASSGAVMDPELESEVFSVIRLLETLS